MTKGEVLSIIGQHLKSLPAVFHDITVDGSSDDCEVMFEDKDGIEWVLHLDEPS